MTIAIRKLITVLAAGFAAPAVAESPPSEFTITIERQLVAEALNDFSNQTGMQVSYFSGESTDIYVGPLSGRYTAEDALAKLLSPSNLKYALPNNRSIAVWQPRRVTAVANAESPAFVRLASVNLVPAEDNRVAAASTAEERDLSIRELEEVVVTAQKRQESIQDVPMSITAMSGDELGARGINNVLDLSFAVPGISVVEMGPGTQLISIRGINSVRGDSPLIGSYLDEIPLSTFQSTFATAPDMRVIDLERIEVLKGPQGTLFGEGSVGGVIRLVTKDPDLTRTGGEMSTDFYNTTDGDWSQEVSGIANIPVGETFGLRVAAKYENISGWIDQPSVGRTNINDSESKHVRVKALFTPTDKIRLKAMAEIHRNDGGGTNIVNQEPVSESNFRQAYDPAAPNGYYDDYDIFNLTATFDLGVAELLSSTSTATFDGNQREIQISGERPTPMLEVLPAMNSRLDRSVIAQELRLTSTSSGAFGWTVGASYKDAKQIAYAGDGLFAIILGGTPEEVALVLGAGARPTTKSESMAGFADASYRIAERITVGGGLRYFTDERETYDPTVPGLGVQSDRFNKLTYRSYLKLQASDATNIYASVGTGFRSGGFNTPDVVERGAALSYDPEETIFYELGAKLELVDGRVRIDGAFFYGEYEGMLEDISTSSPIDNAPLQFTSNAQDAEIQGFELSVDWAATNQLTLSVSGDVTDTEIVRIDPSAPDPTYRIGDRINSVPNYGASVQAHYGFDWSSGMSGFFEVSVNQKGKSYATNRNRFAGLILADQTTAPEVTFVNASVGGEWSGWSWSLFGRNITDEDKLIHASVTGATAQARPRTFGVGISKSF